LSFTNDKISSLNPKWFKNNVAYTMAKYGMSFCVLGMSEEFKEDGIAVNALWPRTGQKKNKFYFYRKVLIKKKYN
jgi:NAD(P)-dependent dehydrogenase (short-subunit alcohol dehydrogenase family)